MPPDGPRTVPGTGRRGFLLGAASLAVPWGTRAQARPLVRVLFIGDSMVGGAFGLFLARALASDPGGPGGSKVKVVREGRPSTGLARPDFFDWHARAEVLVAEHDPHLTLAMFGGNDAQGLYVAKGRWIRWHEPGWPDAYAARVGRLCDILAAQGAHLGWIGMPVMGPARLHRRMVRLNRIYRAETAIRRRARFLDIWDDLADAEGRYARRLRPAPGARAVTVRAGDGVHLTVAGAHLLVERVLPKVRPLLAAAARAAG